MPQIPAREAVQDTMKFYLYDLKEGSPVKVTASYDPKKLELELVDLKFLEPLAMEGEAIKEKETLTFRGRLRSRVRRICGRSLKEVDDSRWFTMRRVPRVSNIRTRNASRPPRRRTKRRTRFPSCAPYVTV
jgi:hypothetical protein